MDIAGDPVLRKRVMTMVDEIYRKAVVPPAKANSMELSLAERRAVDRSVIKYIETLKYVQEAFNRAVLSLKQQNAAKK
jgi:hypothetical protein